MLVFLPKRIRNCYRPILLKALLLLFLIFSFFNGKIYAEVTPAAGEKLFKQYCTSCHAIDRKVVGPPLRDIDKKESEEWLLKWIKNNAALRASGDAHALAIYNEYGKNEMPQFLSFSDDDIKSLLAYIKTGGPAPVKGPEGPNPPPATPAISFWLIAVVFSLFIVALMLWRANTALKKMLREREGEAIPEEITWRRRLTSWKALAFYGLVLAFLFGWTISDSAMRLGHSRNYSPEQPIHFPHDLHAGTLQINCLYCHAGAEKSKVAGIPTIGTCMNCHKGVQEGESPAGTEEIKKIYAAYENNKPVQWVKIHNLPDHVYFNHSQHVVAGKVQCQTCHGQVQEMKQVYQFASLSMGWCLNCHRQTEVQFQSNNYYSMFTSLHEKAKADTSFHVTEAMVGGEECQKCHY